MPIIQIGLLPLATGLSFDGKPITPYYGVNSAASGGNYYGQGAAGTGAIAIGYGASSTNLGTIAIGQNASAKNKHAIAIGLNAKVISDKEHGIAIGGGSLTANDDAKAKVGEPIDYETDAAMAGRNAVAIGYNVRMGEAAHSFGLGTNMIVKGVQNFVLSAASSQSDPTKVYGQANTVIGANNLLDGKSIYQTVGSYEKRYGDIANNLVFGDGNKIIGTADVNATVANYNNSKGAYKNVILGSSNTLNGDNYRNNLLASNATLNKGAHHNTLIGSSITVNPNIAGSYVLGSNVTVTANNSVYFGDYSTAYTSGILRTPNGSSPTPITDATTATDIEKYGLTIGEQGQTKAVIGGRSYNFAGLGQVGGGVISVGRVVGMNADGTETASGQIPDHYTSIGRIIQNVAPGLIGASSTDAVNGSQLYAVTRAIDLSIARVASGENGPLVYTTDSGERLLKENGKFYKMAVTTVTNTETNTDTIYQRATNGFWYPSTSFTNGVLNADVSSSEGKTLEQLAAGRTEGDSSVVVNTSDLVLSVVNAAQDTSDDSVEQAKATKTLTTLKNLKNALTVLATSDLDTAAKDLYIAATANATVSTWDALSAEAKKPWLEKAIINNAKTQLTALLGQTNARTLSQAVNLQDLQTLAYAGLDFAGDSGTTVHRNLSQTLTIKGGETTSTSLTALTDKNIGVVTDSANGALSILLAKNLTNLSSVQLGQTYPWTTPVGDSALSSLTGNTYNNLVTKVDNRGIHLGYTDTKTGENIEKASFTLLGPDTSLPETLITPIGGSNPISPIFATADNGGRGTLNRGVSADPIGKDPNDRRYNNNNGYLFNSANLGLVVGSLAEGAKTSGFTGTGTGFEVFVGLRNGVLDIDKVPNGQPIIFDLSNAYHGPSPTNPNTTIDRTKLPGFSTTEKSSPIAIGAYNTIIGNSGLAVGSLNRVYGNGGIVVGTTSIADGYSTVGRFGITMGFNVKAGEWSQQSVAIGANLQAVGRGNIILGGGQDKYYGDNYWKGADGKDDFINQYGIYTTLGNVFKGSITSGGMRFWGDRNIVLGAKNRTEGFDPNVGGKDYDGSSGNGGYTRIADNAVAGANNSIRDLSFRNSVYGSNNTVTAGADNMIIGSGNDIQAAYQENTSYTYTDATGATKTGYVSGSETATGPILVNTTQAIGNLWRVDTSGSGDSIKAKSSQLLFGDSNSIIGSRNTIQYNTDHNFLAGSDNIAYADSRYNFLAGSKNAAGADLENVVTVDSAVKTLIGSISYGAGTLSNEQKIEIALEKLRTNASTSTGTAGNLLAGSYNIAGQGSSGNIVQGNNVIVRNNVKNSYVLGSRVDVTQSNSVYIGDNSVATLNPTAVTDVDPTTKKTKQTNLQFAADTKFEDLSLRELNTLITAGERGQQAITINGKQYNFAGLGKTGGGVISVGGIRVEGNATDGYKNVSYGRIIQNVAPGLVGANSTDAINGSQLFAIYNAIDATVKQVVSGERGTVVYTTPDGTRLLREGNTLYSQELATGYQRAIDGLWHKKEDFNTDGTLLNPSNIFGKTLLDLNTNGAYFQANDGKWYTRDQLLTEKQQNKYVPKEGATGGLTNDQFATIKAGFTNRTFDSKQVILSLVNADKQANTETEDDATKERTILANLKEALPILGNTDLTAKAKELYLNDNTANTEASWTALGTEGQKTWIAKAASEQAKIAVTALLAKSDVTDAHELSKAATLQDLKTLSIAGLDFAGDSGTNVHRNLSETLAIKGGLTDASKLSDNNIGVVANGTDALVVKLAKDIVGLGSTNYGTVTTGSAPNTTTTPFSGFTNYMASAINPKANVSGTDLYLGSNRAHYTASLDNTGLHLGSGTTEKATVALINPQNSLNPASSADGLSVIFTSANNGGTHVSPTDEQDATKATEVKTAYDGKIFGNAPLGLLVGTMAEGSSNTMQGSTGTGFGVFVGFNNGVVPVTSASGTAFAQPTIFNGVTATRSEAGNVQNAGGSSAVVFGAFNSISGNGGLAVGTLNRVYGNEGIVVGNTTLANSYSSVGRFGVTMGFNVKAGEWSQQSVVIGSNMQAVGQGNIILGGGADKFYGTGSGWNDTPNANGIYTQLTNTFDASEANLNNSGMRFWGDRNIVIGAKNRTEGFNTDFTSSGYTGSTGNGGYTRIADNSVVGTNNTLYDLSRTNSVYGSNNVIASGTNNMVIGSSNKIQAQYTNGGTSTVITGATTGRSEAETAAIAALGGVALDATTGKPEGLPMVITTHHRLSQHRRL